MTDSINATLKSAVEKLKSYISANSGKKSQTDYFRILDGLEQYAIGDERAVEEILSAYYQEITGAIPFQCAPNHWNTVKGRAILMLLDVLDCSEPKRIYFYNKRIYTGSFLPQLVSYEEWQREIGICKSTILNKVSRICGFLAFLETKDVVQAEQVSVEHVLSYLHSKESASSHYKRSISYAIKSFLTSPCSSS